MNDNFSQYENIDAKPEEKKKHGCLISIITMIVIIAVMLLFINIFIKPQATDEDIDVMPGTITLLSTDIIIIPKTDINDLTIRIKFYDKNHNQTDEIIRKLGNVEKGNQYTISIYTAELVIQAWSMSDIKVSVSGNISVWSAFWKIFTD